MLIGCMLIELQCAHCTAAQLVNKHMWRRKSGFSGIYDTRVFFFAFTVPNVVSLPLVSLSTCGQSTCGQSVYLWSVCLLVVSLPVVIVCLLVVCLLVISLSTCGQSVYLWSVYLWSVCLLVVNLSACTLSTCRRPQTDHRYIDRPQVDRLTTSRQTHIQTENAIIDGIGSNYSVLYKHNE